MKLGRDSIWPHRGVTQWVMQEGRDMPLGTTIQAHWKRSQANFHYRRPLTVPPERLAVGPNLAPVLDQAGGQGSGISVGGVKNEPMTSAHIWGANNYPLLYLL